tara:strand:- start:288 stop:1073 length:786 start_codon:yes stop_codon:yes gene_type:complete
MKMVSAAKLKKAQDAIIAMRPYSEKLSDLMKGLSGSSDDDRFTENRDLKNILIVAISSNRGLCGAFNANVLKQIAIFKSHQNLENSNIDYVTIGKKMNDSLSKNDNVILNESSLFDDLNYENVSVITEKLITLFIEKKYDHIEIVYNSFKNAATQIIKSEQFLPIVQDESANSQNSNFIFEPSQESIVNTLIPKSLKIQLFKAVRDSFASEHGARMTAMHKATDNASELRDELKLTYNKARQASITNEILEIVGGAEALNN